MTATVFVVLRGDRCREAHHGIASRVTFADAGAQARDRTDGLCG